MTSRQATFKRNLLELLHVLCISIGMTNASSELISAMQDNFRHVSLREMLEEINHVLDSDTQAHRQAFISRTQHCFAVKNGADGLLDIARATFCRLTEEIHMLATSYREQTDVDIKVCDFVLRI